MYDMSSCHLLDNVYYEEESKSPLADYPILSFKRRENFFMGYSVYSLASKENAPFPIAETWDVDGINGGVGPRKSNQHYMRELMSATHHTIIRHDTPYIRKTLHDLAAVSTASRRNHVDPGTSTTTPGKRGAGLDKCPKSERRCLDLL
ncbi:hypothetical protein ANO14919_058210 [Xylariales sp. No.14919]|nr:hypothetical protein ANO14919_058210 [Xylariales sp. No.14919]